VLWLVPGLAFTKYRCEFGTLFCIYASDKTARLMLKSGISITYTVWSVGVIVRSCISGLDCLTRKVTTLQSTDNPPLQEFASDSRPELGKASALGRRPTVTPLG